jgi:beta-glucosidase
LSYTQFKYSNLRLSSAKIYQGGDVDVKVDVTNVGNRSGAETVQMYVHERYTPVATPVKQMRGFEQVALNPGETRTVTMKLTPDDLMLLDRDMHWTVFPGTFDIMVGRSSADILFTAPLQVLGADPLVGQGLNR